MIKDIYYFYCFKKVLPFSLGSILLCILFVTTCASNTCLQKGHWSPNSPEALSLWPRWLLFCQLQYRIKGLYLGKLNIHWLKTWTFVLGFLKWSPIWCLHELWPRRRRQGARCSDSRTGWNPVSVISISS